jgi:hypothetical protein
MINDRLTCSSRPWSVDLGLGPNEALSRTREREGGPLIGAHSVPRTGKLHSTEPFGRPWSTL